MRGTTSMLADAVERLLPVLLILAVAAAVLLAWRLAREPGRRQHAVDETLRDLALAAAIAAIVVVTLLTPSRMGDDADIELIPFVDLVRALAGRYSLRNALIGTIGNVVLFIPFGMALRWRWPGLSVVAVAGCALALSAGVEVAQATLGGRWANVTDVITNTAGGAIGAMLIGSRVSRLTEG